jgi:hypothetical protein
MILRRAFGLLPGAIALAMPAAPAGARAIDVVLCGIPGASVTIPIDGAPMPANHDCCKGLACHAACERKHGKRLPGEDDRDDG